MNRINSKKKNLIQKNYFYDYFFNLTLSNILIKI